MENVGGCKMKVGLEDDPNCDCDARQQNQDILEENVNMETDESGQSHENDTNCDSSTKKESSSILPDGKLRGWLNLNSTRGIIKTNRHRWFVFSDNTCKLYYYRNPHDFVQLGEIDIAHATFYFDPSNTEKPGSFEIRSDNREHVLEATDRGMMMCWLQELQKRRRVFAKQRNSISKFRTSHIQVHRTQKMGGLVTSKDVASSSETREREEKENKCDIPEITIPSKSNDVAPLIDFWNNSAPSTEDLRKPDSISLGSNTKYETLPKTTSSPDPSPSQENWTIVDQPVMFRNKDVQSSESKTGGQGKLISALRKIKRGKIVQRGNSNEESSAQGASVGQQGVVCYRCKQLQEDMEHLRQELASQENELDASRDTVRLLQKEVDYQQKEIRTRHQAKAENNSGLHQMLQERNKRINDLEHTLSKLNESNAVNEKKLRSKEEEVISLQDQVNMLKNILQVKDEIIEKLTNDIFELEKNNNFVNSENSQEAMKQVSRGSTSSEPNNNELKEMCEAYELQNKFLTKEILELNELRQTDEATIKSFSDNYAKLEAKFCQTRSKYLFLLKDIKEPVRGENDKTQDIVNQLLEDALSPEESEDIQYYLASSGQDHDRYGFVKRHLSDVEGDEDDPLVLEAQKMERRSSEVSNKLKDASEDASHQIKWENFMVSQAGKPLQRSTELKLLMRSGVPHEYRETIWKGCVEIYIGSVRDKLGPTYYKTLVSKSSENMNFQNAKQIELDLLRTLPNNKHYESLECEGISKLRNVLLAFSWHNPLIGYCQGLNRIVAIILLFLAEEEAFWCLVAIVDHIMPKEYYTSTLLAAQTDQRVLKDLIQEKFPRLFLHFKNNKVDLSLFTFNWFLTIFVDNIPTETFLRIWDAFLYEGNKVLFRFALAFFKHGEEEILKKTSSLDLNRYMRNMGEKMSDVKKIAQIAFHTVNPFPMKNITTKRQFYMQQVKGELAEMDRMRKQLQSQQQVQDCRDFYSDDDLDG